MGGQPSNNKLVIPISPTEACKTILYWDEPLASFSVYPPGTTKITGTPVQSQPSGTKSFSIDLNTPGTWFIIANHNLFGALTLAKVTARFTTQ